MMTGIMHDQNLEKEIQKQMGCMTGFLQLFDRHHFLIVKRLYTPKRLPPTPVDYTPESEKSVGPPPSPDRLKQTPATELRSPTIAPARFPLTLPILEFKEGTKSPWKFSKDTPRLSLDSRAIVDSKGSLYPREIRTNAAILSANRSEEDDDKQHRSPGVIARLMGLEPLPNSSHEQVKKSELRRSASESRLSRDLFQSQFINCNNFQSINVPREISSTSSNAKARDRTECSSRNSQSETPMTSHCGRRGSPWISSQQRKSFFDSEDLFPEPKQTITIYGEIEKRLKMRGIDEPSQDLEALKQILESLQLKGLLHSTKPSHQIGRRNFVHDRRFSSIQSPIVQMKPTSSPISPIKQRFKNESPSFTCRTGVRRSLNFSGENGHQNVVNQARARNSRSPIRTENNSKGTNSPIKLKPLSIETQRRVSPVHSPKLISKRIGSDQTTITRSPRNRNPTAENELSSQTYIERSRMEENKDGRSILERCDKLLHSIAEMNATELQPSPVSVLDSFYKDESSSPSSVMKRRIVFKEQLVEVEEEIWSPPISTLESKPEDPSDDCDYVYISEILRAYHYLPEDSDIFLLLEKQQSRKGKDISKVSTLQRRQTFDTITEILDRNRQLPPWKAFSWPSSNVGQPSLQHIWSEFQRIRQRDTAENLLEIICGILRKDLDGDTIKGWDDCPVEISEAVLDIERLIFKDMVRDTIQDLVEFAMKSIVSAPCRKLIF